MQAFVSKIFCLVPPQDYSDFSRFPTKILEQTIQSPVRIDISRPKASVTFYFDSTGGYRRIRPGHGRSGASLIVGGNTAGVTRGMTTTIALETNMGSFELELGINLLGVS